MKENFEYTAEMGFGNWDMGILGFGIDRTKRKKGKAEMGFGDWDVRILGFGRDRTKRKIREYVRKRR